MVFCTWVLKLSYWPIVTPRYFTLFDQFITLLFMEMWRIFSVERWLKRTVTVLEVLILILHLMNHNEAKLICLCKCTTAWFGLELNEKNIVLSANRRVLARSRVGRLLMQIRYKVGQRQDPCETAPLIELGVESEYWNTRCRMLGTKGKFFWSNFAWNTQLFTLI